MFKIQFSLGLSIFVYTLSALIITLTNWTPSVKADCLIWFLCSSQGSGVAKSGATRRGSCASTGAETPLIALVRENQLESTTQAYPTFWFYLPSYPFTVKEARFVLLDADTYKVTKQIQVKLPGTSGIAQFTLPNTEKSLEVGKQYTWFFEVICDQRRRDRNPIVDGRIERVKPDAQRSNQRPEKPYLVTANNQLVWYDTLTQLARNNTLFEEDWMALLKGSEIPESMAQQPFLELEPVNESELKP